jgi:hypothetical protein
MAPRGDHDQIAAPAQEKLAGDEAGLDGLAEAHVVRDEEIDPRQPQRLRSDGFPTRVRWT